ncbi:hypothetical protein DPMN_093795 [Dreissena polymorpha]|uniref:Uncharacterized protein n=1 Tax=Dreissena polymorpha TaxID=45954 RepID=A0A9D4L3M0_DREPO|nr:hypothetical protein DPMN_093795 [Dreissena polymorpha]
MDRPHPSRAASNTKKQSLTWNLKGKRTSGGQETYGAETWLQMQSLWARSEKS